jgi:hypothetical protein
MSATGDARWQWSFWPCQRSPAASHLCTGVQHSADFTCGNRLAWRRTSTTMHSIAYPQAPGPAPCSARRTLRIRPRRAHAFDLLLPSPTKHPRTSCVRAGHEDGILRCRGDHLSGGCFKFKHRTVLRVNLGHLI